jgi:hypothetical protein
LKKTIASFFLAIGISFYSFSQKAEVYKLEKLYEPEKASKNFQAWKNEWVLIPVRLDSKDRSEVSFSYNGPSAEVELYMLHEIWADFSAGNCGESKASGTFEKALIPDRAEKIERGKFDPVSDQQWLLIRVKPDFYNSSGSHPVSINFSQKGKNTQVKINLNLLDRTLGELSKGDFYTDFWQFPIAMADYYQIKPWSEKHWEEVSRMFDQLRGINQHSVTTSIFWDLYNTRIRPVEEMMIQVKKSEKGEFFYDYTVFDRYVELAFQKGIDGQIAVHNIFPWNNFLFYLDEATNETVSIQTPPGTPEYKDFWKPLVLDLSKHLKAKGWMDKSLFFIDERDPNQTLELIRWIKSFAPEFQFGFAGDFYPFLSPWVIDYSTPMNVVIEGGDLQKRILNAQNTSLYTSCYERANQPNLLLTSDLRDIYFLTHLANAKSYQGMLRWAFNLWSREIMSDAIYSELPSGDAHLVYPDGQFSLRYLVIIDALEEIAKLKTISKVKETSEMIIATNRYFLINIEADRHQMVEAFKNYLND